LVLRPAGRHGFSRRLRRSGRAAGFVRRRTSDSREIWGGVPHPRARTRTSARRAAGPRVPAAASGRHTRAADVRAPADSDHSGAPCLPQRDVGCL